MHYLETFSRSRLVVSCRSVGREESPGLEADRTFRGHDSGDGRRNESEAEHGKFDGIKTKIINKSRVVESLMGEEHSKEEHGKDTGQEDQIALAKKMDRGACNYK